MLITCPACASEYEIDAGRIGSIGRKVRCAACRESWFITAPAEAEIQAGGDGVAEPSVAFAAPVPVADATPQPAESAVVIEAEPPPPRRERPKPAPRARKGRTRADAAARPSRTGRSTALMAAALLCLALSAIPLRTAIVNALPRTASLFNGIGLPVNLVGLSLDGVASTLSQENGAPVLVVTGRVRNVSGAARRALPLQIAIESEIGQPLYTWSARVADVELAAGEETAFRVRLASPPPAGHRVEVTFRDERERLAVALH